MKKDTGLSPRQEKFAEYYAECGNTVQAALRAGYSENYANSRAYELLENVGVSEYIRALSEKAQRERILTALERQELLSSIAKNNGEEAADRIKAIDVLNKMTGEYTQNLNVAGEMGVTIVDSV